MTEWHSERFSCTVILTKHAIARMQERKISFDMVREVNRGRAQSKDEHRLWIYHAFKERDDKLICAAVVLEDKLVIKTLMHRWQLMEATHEN